MDLAKILGGLQSCACGKRHEADMRTVAISEKLTADAGYLLAEASFPKNLHVVYDQNTLAASAGLWESLQKAGFSLIHTGFDDLQTSDEKDVAKIAEEGREAEAVLSIGTGSLNDICRYHSFQTNRPFAIFATAPSMDGFASSMAPITTGGFKRTYQAKTPEVILADTEILAKSPAVLKAAGLGDLLGKYTAHADWVAAALLTGEYYCEAVAGLTRNAVDKAVTLAEESNTNSVSYAASLMEALVLSGFAMQLCGCTRPASGAEHHLAHFWEMQYSLQGRKQLFHGQKVGVATGLLADVYNDLAAMPCVVEQRREIDEAALAAIFGPLWQEARKENIPNPLDEIPAGKVEAAWPEIRKSLQNVPSGAKIRALLAKSGGTATYKAAGIPKELARQGLVFGRYARFRITMMRLLDRLAYEPAYEKYLIDE